MPSYVIYGDGFLVSQALKDVEAQVGPPEVLDANCHRLVGNQVHLGELKSICAAVPFLADKRLVVIQDLLGSFEATDGRRRPATSAARARRGDSGRTEGSNLGEWQGLAGYIGGEMAPTTLLVFQEAKLSNSNPLLRSLREVCQVQEHPTPIGEGLSRWIRNRANDKGAQITPGAIRILSQFIGNNLWTMDNELEKLSLYAGDKPIEEAHVNLLVSEARESSIFVAVDALLDGRSGNCLRLMHHLMVDGAEFPYMVTMISRQLRLVTLAKDLLEGSYPPKEISSRLRITHDFALRRTLDQARRFPWPVLEQLYTVLMKSDLAVKRGQVPQEVAMELMVGEMSGLVSAALPGSRRGRP